MFEIDGYDPKSPPRTNNPRPLLKLEALLRQGRHVSDADLASAIRLMPDDMNLPPAVRDHVAGRLDGSIKRKGKGRPPGAKTRKDPKTFRDHATLALTRGSGIPEKYLWPIFHVKVLKHRFKRRFGAVPKLHDQVVERAARRYGLDLERLHREINRSRPAAK